LKNSRSQEQQTVNDNNRNTNKKDADPSGAKEKPAKHLIDAGCIGAKGKPSQHRKIRVTPSCIGKKRRKKMSSGGMQARSRAVRYKPRENSNAWGQTRKKTKN